MVNKFLGNHMPTRRKEQEVGKKMCYKMLVTTLLCISYTAVNSCLQILDGKDCTAEERHQMSVDCLSFYL